MSERSCDKDGSGGMDEYEVALGRALYLCILSAYVPVASALSTDPIDYRLRLHMQPQAPRDLALQLDKVRFMPGYRRSAQPTYYALGRAAAQVK